MKERPILFSGEMIKAILEGKKTQTRRLIIRGIVGRKMSGNQKLWPYLTRIKDSIPVKCPYGEVGDRLWTKETWRVGAWQQDERRIAVDYKVDGFCRKGWVNVENDEIFIRLWQQSSDDAEKVFGKLEKYKWQPGASPCRWRSARFMPRFASRIILEIVNIRVERLQDIKIEDCFREGIRPCRPLDEFGKERIIFQKLWDSINIKRTPWSDNPWVWVIEFRRIK